MKKYLFVLLWLLSFNQGFAQSLDSLLNAFHQQQALEKGEIANKIAAQYIGAAQYDSALLYLGKAETLSKQNHYDSLLINVYNNTGVVYSYLNDYIQSTTYYLKAVDLYDPKYGLDLKHSLYINLGSGYELQGDYERALQYSEEALDVLQQIPDTDSLLLSHTLVQKANIYKDMDSLIQAEQFYEKALAITRRHEFQELTLNIWLNLGALYYVTNREEKAYRTWKKALAIADDFLYLKTVLLSDIGKYFSDKQQHHKAIEYYKQALKIAQEIEVLLAQSLAYYNLAEAYASMGQYDQAYEYLQEHTLLEDSIFNEEKHKTIATLQAKFNVEQKQKEILQLEKQQAEQTLQLKQKEFWNKLLVGGLGVAFLLAGVMIYFFYYLQRKNHVISRQQNQLVNQNQQLQVSEQHLKEAYHTQSRFFSIIAHDLRSPISNLHIFLSLLKSESKEADASQWQNYLGLLEEELGNVELLLNNLLHWAMDQQDAINFTPTKVEIAPVVQHIVQLIRQQAAAQKIVLIQELNMSKPINTDRDMLAFILRNLLTNALKFTPAQGFIRISCSQQEQAILLEVFNTGSSISEEEAANLFQLRVKPGMLPSEKKGVGLGLYLSKQFAQKMGGELWVDHQAKEGVSFFLSLPLASQNAAEATAYPQHSVEV